MQVRRSHFYIALVFFLVGAFYGLYAYEKRMFPFVTYKILTTSNSLSVSKPDTSSTTSETPADTRWRTRVQSKTGGKNKQLEGLGYLQGYEQASGLKGVVAHNPGRSYPGYNLYVSGHGPEAELINMEGDVLHRWKVPWHKAFPDIPPEQFNTDRVKYLRKFHLFPNGDALFIFEWLGLVKVDRQSRVLWSNFNRAHHDLWVGSDGRIYALTSGFKDVGFDETSNKRVIDYISILDTDGNLIRKVSLLKAIKNSEYSAIFDFTHPGERKPFHTNTLEILTEDHPELGPAFSKGHALISMRNTNMLAIVDLEKEKIVWTMAGFSEEQHDPVLLDNNNLLIFDNRGHHDRSKVIEVDPLTQEIKWGFYGTKENNFASKCCGTNQRLPNGNTLITDTSHGRAFEVTPDGDIVWDFYNPHRTGEDNSLIASVFAMKRYPESFFSHWDPTSDS